MTHPKLREAVARAIKPHAFRPTPYKSETSIEQDDAFRATDRVLALPEIADALKREEDTAIQDWLEDHGHEIHICCWHHTKEGKENEWTIHKGDFDDDNLIGAGKLFRDACRAAMSGGEKLDGKDTPQGGK